MSTNLIINDDAIVIESIVRVDPTTYRVEVEATPAMLCFLIENKRQFTKEDNYYVFKVKFEEINGMMYYI